MAVWNAAVRSRCLGFCADPNAPLRYPRARTIDAAVALVAIRQPTHGRALSAIGAVLPKVHRTETSSKLR